MDSKARTNVEGDRLSILPDDLIHKILSFMSIKHAIETSALSSRWRFIWTSIPYFNISSDDFRTLPNFSKFVNHVLSRRNTQIELYSSNLRFHETVCEALLKTILDYAFSHNLQQLTITCLSREKIDFPLHLFRSHPLKYLRLTGFKSNCPDKHNVILAPTWELPGLTTLHLDHVAFYDDNINGVGLFSKCVNLKNLTLSNFNIVESRSFTIKVCHPQLSNLTLENGYFSLVKVVAPLLKTLTSRSCFGDHLIAAPHLVSLLSCNSCLLGFSSDLCCLEKVDLCIYPVDTWRVWNVCQIGALLQQLHNVKFLTLNLEFVKPIISYLEQISLQRSLFSNLKSLKIYPVHVPSDDKVWTLIPTNEKVNLSTKVINYLLDGSPTATFTLISYEEIKKKQQKAQALANAIKAQNLMARLQAMLEEKKANTESNITRVNQWKKTMQRHEANVHDEGMAPVEKMQLHFKRKMKLMKACCEVVSEQIDQGGKDTSHIISKLREIEVLLLKDLPASKRDELQVHFSSLCAEVDSVVKKILHHMNIPQIQLSDCFSVLATTTLRSS